MTVEEGFPQHGVGAEIWLISLHWPFCFFFVNSWKLCKVNSFLEQHICHWREFWLSWCTGWENCWGWCPHALCSKSGEDGCSTGNASLILLYFLTQFGRPVIVICKLIKEYLFWMGVLKPWDDGFVRIEFCIWWKIRCQVVEGFNTFLYCIDHLNLAAYSYMWMYRLKILFVLQKEHATDLCLWLQLLEDQSRP